MNMRDALTDGLSLVDLFRRRALLRALYASDYSIKFHHDVLELVGLTRVRTDQVDQ